MKNLFDRCRPIDLFTSSSSLNRRMATTKRVRSIKSVQSLYSFYFKKLPIIDHEITKKCKGNSSSRLVYHLGQLPDEIILMILTYLNQSSIVAFGQTSRRNHAIA